MLPDYSAGYGLDQSGNPVTTNQGLNQGLFGLGQQGGGNPLYPMGSTIASDGGVSTKDPSYQAQNSGTAQAQSATQPQMNTGNPNDQFLNNLYSKYLGRAADPSGMQYYQNELNSGLSATDLINQFQKSPEAANYQAMQSVSPSYTGNANPWSLTGANATGNQASTNPYIQAAQQTALGNYQGAQTATSANRVNQSTPYSNLNYTQTGTDANGNPIWSANQSLAGPLAGAQSSLAQGVANQAAQGFNPNTPSVGINPGQLYSDAIMQRLQPQQAHAQEQQAASLANQGIAPGTDAYNNAMRTFQQGQNDQLTSAQVGGIGVGLQANQQAFNQQLQQANLPYQQLGAFQQATQPGYVNPYNQQAVSGPDYTNAYSTAQNAQIAQQNQQIAQQANLQNGLFGLGSSAILGAGGVGNLANSAVNGATNAYNWLTGISSTPGLGQTTNALGQVITDPTYGQGGSAINYASQLGDVGNVLGI